MQPTSGPTSRRVPILGAPQPCAHLCHQALHRPCHKLPLCTGIRMQGIRIQDMVPCLNHSTGGMGKTHSAGPQWLKLSLFLLAQENPLKAKELRDNYSFGTKLHLVNIKLWHAKTERNEWLCVGEEKKEEEIWQSVPFIALTLLMNQRKKLDANEIINYVRNPWQHYRNQ